MNFSAIERHQVDLFAQRRKLLGAAIVAFVCGKFSWIVPEQFAAPFDGRFDKLVLDGFMRKHVVMGDELLGHLLDLDHVSELDGLAGFASYEQFGVRLEDAEELLVVGRLPSFDDALMGLFHDLIGQAPEVEHPLRRVYEETRRNG